jgi:hypothetical protein
MGVEHQFLLADVQAKCKDTIMQRYDVLHVAQNAEIYQKQLRSAFRLKQFKFPDGTIIDVQGYEPYLLQILVEDGYVADDMLTNRTDVPEIWYTYNNKKCRYYCDVFIPKTNTIYEVKSTWTYQMDIEKNKCKQQACIDAGYNFEFYIFNHKGQRELHE